jgi:4-amino-4-deoxy-L-arabinose transferase-like glycosyltransferase
MRQRISLVILIFMIALLAMSPILLAKGMFMDGLIYSCVALNLKNGVGDFWHLQFTQTLYAQFHEHPPLAMWMQSLFMDIFGTDYWVDRMFSILCVFTQGLLILKIAESVFQRSIYLAYWPLLFFLFTPLTLWMMPNNLLENTMGIFTLTATLTALLAHQKRKMSLAILSGLMISLAVYTKGPVGLFPFSFFVWLFFIQENRRHFTFYFGCFSMQLLGFLSGFFVPFLFSSEAQSSWKAYWDRQVINSIENVSTVPHRFYILQQTFLHILPMIALLFLIYLILKRKKKISLSHEKSKVFFWLIYGLSGIAPMMISMKQREFYLLPALPFVILSICILAQPVLLHMDDWIVKFSPKKIGLFSLIVLIASCCISYSQKGKMHRNIALQKDIEQMSSHIEPNQKVGIAPCLREDWSLYGYCYRHYYWSLETLSDHTFFISKKVRCSFPEAKFRAIEIPTQDFVLYTKISEDVSNLTPSLEHSQ